MCGNMTNLLGHRVCFGHTIPKWATWVAVNLFLYALLRLLSQTLLGLFHFLSEKKVESHAMVVKQERASFCGATEGILDWFGLQSSKFKANFTLYLSLDIWIMSPSVFFSCTNSKISANFGVQKYQTWFWISLHALVPKIRNNRKGKIRQKIVKTYVAGDTQHHRADLTPPLVVLHLLCSNPHIVRNTPSLQQRLPYPTHFIR